MTKTGTKKQRQHTFHGHRCYRLAPIECINSGHGSYFYDPYTLAALPRPNALAEPSRKQLGDIEADTMNFAFAKRYKLLKLVVNPEQL